MLAIMRKRFGDAGLRDVAVESGVIADGSIAGVLDGRKYNRAIRLHKLMYEALMRLAWAGFEAWLGKNEKDNLTQALTIVKDLVEDISGDKLQELLQMPPYVHIMQLFHQYLDLLTNDNGKLSSLWMSYVDMVEIILGLLRSSREGDFLLHLASTRAMIPWCFSYDRLNYARYLPIYYAQMSNLGIDHPGVYAHFMQPLGGFRSSKEASTHFEKFQWIKPSKRQSTTTRKPLAGRRALA